MDTLKFVALRDKKTGLIIGICSDINLDSASKFLIDNLSLSLKDADASVLAVVRDYEVVKLADFDMKKCEFINDFQLLVSLHDFNFNFESEVVPDEV